jgi:dTDP-4-dehydrorhamnose reductase
MGYKEDDETGPVNKYAQTKLMGEREIITRSSQGLKYYLIRTSKLFGPVGESKTSKLSFFDLMLDLAKDKEKLTAVDEEVSCFTYTADLAKETKRIIEDKENYGVYHIVNSSFCTWFEAAVELFRIANVSVLTEPVSSDSFPRPAKRPKYSVLLNTKLNPLRDWREALKEYLNQK